MRIRRPPPRVPPAAARRIHQTFSFKGIFLLEAVFTAIYLYGWDRLPPWPHFWTIVPVAVSGILGALSVVAANSWMNDPSGFTLVHGRVTSVDPVAVFFNGATYYEVPHMILAAYMVAGGLTATPYATERDQLTTARSAQSLAVQVDQPEG